MSGFPRALPCRVVAHLVVLGAALATLPASAASLLAAPFQDHAVLQRDQPIPVWGQAEAGANIQLRMADRTVHVRADREGAWQAQLPALAAGGPYELEVKAAGQVQRVEDLLIGDVWLCSGQSNMELPVNRSLDALSEIGGAGNDRMRLLTIPKISSPVPKSGFEAPLSWKPVTPQSVADFSAACYYFARELQQHQDVPMGLINASWGGSRIEAWMSEDALRQAGGHEAALDVLSLYARDPATGTARWGALWQHWWQGLAGQAGDAPWKPDAPGPWTAATPSQQWLAPALADVVGVAWYRATVELDAGQAAQPASLELGPVDEIDLAWGWWPAAATEPIAAVITHCPAAPCMRAGTRWWSTSSTPIDWAGSAARPRARPWRWPTGRACRWPTGTTAPFPKRLEIRQRRRGCRPRA